MVSAHFQQLFRCQGYISIISFSSSDVQVLLANLDHDHTYTGKLCHCGKCHSGNCHSGERWMSRPFVHSGNLNFKHTLTNDLVFHKAGKRIICHFIT